MRNNRILLVALVLILCGAGVTFAYQYRGQVKQYLSDLRAPELPMEEPVTVSVLTPEPSPTPKAAEPKVEPKIEPKVEPKKEEKIPAQKNLAVPFTTQAPHQNWDMPYQEACEEATVLMLDAFIKGYALTPDSADAALLKIVDWENKNLGYYKDTTTAETLQILKSHFGIKNVVIKTNVTAELIRKEIALGHPVILPTAGRMLKNPNFKAPGPLYHMVVVKGYLADGRFITHDPGTRNGKDYIYTEEVLLNATHDWNGGDVANGQKVMITIQ
ncbi:C39 family peptidase [Candidatus Gracilibacteria bacterium]|nr:C39 family peptidase [Candidatus Gracilibacteria bacterium]